MPLDDPFHQRQAEAHARIRRVIVEPHEGLEYALAIGRRDSRSIIVDVDDGGVLRRLARTITRFFAKRPALLNRLPSARCKAARSAVIIWPDPTLWSASN